MEIDQAARSVAKGALKAAERGIGIAERCVTHREDFSTHVVPRRFLFQSRENRFRFFVISAAPREVVQSALEGIVPPENIFGTEFGFDPESGEISHVVRVPEVTVA